MQRKRSMPKMFWEMVKAIFFAAIICSIILFSLSFLLDKGWGKFVIQVLNMIVSGGILYSTMWYYGDREKNFVQFGRMGEDLNWGTKVGLVGMLFPMATGILLILGKALAMPDLVIFYKLMNPQINMLINLFIPLVDTDSFGVVQIILVFLLYLYVPLFTTLGYRMGYARISLSEKLVYRKKDGEEKETESGEKKSFLKKLMYKDDPKEK